MHEFNEWECYNAFLKQCTCDKSYIKDLYNRYRPRILACGRHLLEKAVRWSYIIPLSNETDSYREFIDFIDGNGFIVTEFQPNMYHITPQYPEEIYPF